MTQEQEHADDKKPGLIYKQIPKIMSELKPIAKSQMNKQQGFRFRGIDDVYNHVQAVMSKHGVFTVANILDRQRAGVTTKSGSKAYHCVNNYRFRFFAEDGSYVCADADGEAMDTGDKASNKCAAIAHKYALLQTFCIPTEDLQDPDSEKPVIAQPQDGKAHADPASGQVSEAQLKRLFAISRGRGMRPEDTDRLCRQMFGVDKTNLTRKQYDQLCNRIEGKSVVQNNGSL